MLAYLLDHCVCVTNLMFTFALLHNSVSAADIGLITVLICFVLIHHMPDSVVKVSVSFQPLCI